MVRVFVYNQWECVFVYNQWECICLQSMGVCICLQSMGVCICLQSMGVSICLQSMGVCICLQSMAVCLQSKINKQWVSFEHKGKVSDSCNYHYNPFPLAYQQGALNNQTINIGSNLSSSKIFRSNVPLSCFIEDLLSSVC